MKPKTNWLEKIPMLKEIQADAVASNIDRLEYEKAYNIIEDEIQRSYNTDALDEEVEPKILESFIIQTVDEEFCASVAFPELEIEPKRKKDDESIMKASIAMGLFKHIAKKSGYEAAFNESKGAWTMHGNPYRRPFIKTVNEKKRMIVEDIEPNMMLLDTSSVSLHSESVGKSSSYAGFVIELSAKQVKRRFGEDVLKWVDIGAAIDPESLKKDNTATTEEKDFYQMVWWQDASIPGEFLFLGSNFFPVYAASPKTKDWKKPKGCPCEWETEYRHKNEDGENVLTVHSTALYRNRKNIRAKGIGHKLYRAQIFDRLLRNLSGEAARLRSRSITSMQGVGLEMGEMVMDEYESERDKNIFTILKLPQTIDGKAPSLETVQFGAATAQESQIPIDEHSRYVKNITGVDPSRQEIKGGEGLGQTEILAEEKVKTVKEIVAREKPNIEREVKALILFVVNHKGYGSDEEIEYERRWVETGLEGEEIKLVGPDKMTIMDAAKALEDFDMDVNIDMGSFINKLDSAMLERVARVAAETDGAAMPALKAKLLQKTADTLGISTNDSDFEGVQNEIASGGGSNFQQQ